VLPAASPPPEAFFIEPCLAAAPDDKCPRGPNKNSTLLRISPAPVSARANANREYTTCFPSEITRGAFSAELPGAHGQSPACAARCHTFMGRRVRTVERIRRSLGAFTLAAIVAAALVAMPTAAEAVPRSTTGDLDAFCADLQTSIDHVVNSPYDDATKAALLEPLESSYNTYCIYTIYTIAE
jgi:hypothetical protein